MKLVLLVLMLLPGRAVADDNASTADTVASTWSGGALGLSADDQRFLLAITSLHRGVRTRFEVSAPLDDDTRTAAFVGKGGVAPGFRAAAFVGLDSSYKAVDFGEDDAKVIEFCKHNKVDPCTRSAAVKADEANKQNGQPRGGLPFSWSVGINASLAYDRVTAFRDITTSDEFPTSNLQLDAAFIGSWASGWTLTARAGYERANDVTLRSFRRCRQIESTDPMLTGESCSDAKLLVDNPKAASSTHVRASVAYYPHDGLLAEYVSACELRVNAENLSTEDASLDTHLLAFANAVDLGKTSARIGIGLTVRTAMESPSGVDYGSGDIYDYSLFGIVGASF